MSQSTLFLAELTRLQQRHPEVGHRPNPEDYRARETDWRGRFHGRALAFCEPSSVEGLKAVVALAARHAIPIVAQGGNTSLVGGSVPLASEPSLLLGLQRLNAVRAFDPLGRTLTAEAGMTLQAAQEFLAPHGLWIPLDLGSRGSATLGGLLACNAGGMEVLRHGSARAQCLGLEVVLANGEVISDLRALRKNNTGPDLKQLFVGTEGSLGIIAAATWALAPRPETRATALVAVADASNALTLLARMQHSLGDLLHRCEWMEAGALELVRRQRPQDCSWSGNWGGLLLVDAAGGAGIPLQSMLEDSLAGAAAEGLASDVWIAQSQAQAEAFWRLREAIPMASASQGAQIKLDIALPLGALPDFFARAEAALSSHAPGWRPVVFGHLGDGSLHYNLAPPADAPQTWAFVEPHENAIAQAVYAVVDALGGTISAEHGLGQLKDAEAAQRRSPSAQRIVAGLKAVLDPMHLLNRGRVLGLPARPAPARIAVVGAGMAGLTFAATQQRAGSRIAIFEKSRGASGRASTRRGDGWRCDHGAVAFAAQTPWFGAVLDEWMGQGLAAPWQAEGRGLWIVGSPNMTTPLQTLATRLRDAGSELHLETQIRSMGRAPDGDPSKDGSAAGWWLTDDGGARHGPFDAVVLAIPPLQAQAILAQPLPHLAAQLEGAQAGMRPCWTAMLVLDEPLERAEMHRLTQWGSGEASPPPGGSSESPDFLRIVCQSTKPGREALPQVWCLQASDAWSSAHLEDSPEAVAEALRALAEQRVGCALPGSIVAHRWRFAFPAAEAAPPEAPVGYPLGYPLGYLWDAEHSVGVCGDALGHALLPRPDDRGLHAAEAAWLSGNALAVASLQHLAALPAQLRP